jgi:perosamine synthetase
MKSTFINDVIDLFDWYKSSHSIKEAYLKSMELTNGSCLIPISHFHLKDELLIADLTDWRNRNVTAYPTQFTATVQTTRKWLLEGVLKNEGRILFLVVDKFGSCLGHIGFNNCLSEDLSFEIDNVVRGRQGVPGLFSSAMTRLCDWAESNFPLDKLHLRVMGDNFKAIRFYEKLGWQVIREIPLKRVISAERTDFIEISSDGLSDSYDASMLRMEYQRSISVGAKMILTAGPSISAMEASFAFEAASTGWNSEWSGYLSKFEDEFAEYVGVDYAIATSSCTGALHIALMALEIGPGDEVIVPDQTWVATAKAVQYVGATPVFADVELDTWNLDPASVESKITTKTRAIMPVHMYGHPTRMDPILDLAHRYGLKVVEDAAPAIGAEWQGRRCGSFGDFAGFSFQGAKLLVTGEGGMLVTSDGDLYERAKKVWDQGRNPAKAFWIDAPGVKYKMANVQAAVGLGQLRRIDALIAMKRRVFSWYQERLSDIPGVYLNEEVDGAKSIYWMSSIRLDQNLKVGRDELISILKAKNIDTRPVFPAISQYPIWGKNLAPQPNAALIGAQSINLPSGVCLKQQEVDYVCSAIREIIEE